MVDSEEDSDVESDLEAGDSDMPRGMRKRRSPRSPLNRMAQRLAERGSDDEDVAVTSGDDDDEEVGMRGGGDRSMTPLFPALCQRLPVTP